MTLDPFVMRLYANMPSTFEETIARFVCEEDAILYVAAHRPEWTEGILCPLCGDPSPFWRASRGTWQCRRVHSKRVFGVRQGTILERSHVPISKWLIAIWLYMHEAPITHIAQIIDITPKSAWRIVHLIRGGTYQNRRYPPRRPH